MAKKMNCLKYVLFVLLSVLFISCGDDNKTDNIRYYQSEIIDFNVYAGSKTGANKIRSNRFDSTAVFTSLFELYTTDATILFDDGMVYINQSSAVRERSEYRFVDSLLYISVGGVEQYYGRGNEKNLRVRQHYVGYKSTDDAITLFQGPAKDEVTLEDAIKSAQKARIPEGDTIMWATRISYFQ